MTDEPGFLFGAQRTGPDTIHIHVECAGAIIAFETDRKTARQMEDALGLAVGGGFHVDREALRRHHARPRRD